MPPIIIINIVASDVIQLYNNMDTDTTKNAAIALICKNLSNIA